MSQSAGTSGFAPAWGVHHCPSLQASEGGSSYGSRGRPPDTTGRAVPLTGFSEGVLGGRPQATHCISPQSRSRTNIHKDQPTMPAGTTPPSSPTPDTQRLHLPNSTEGSRTVNPATSQQRLIPSTWRGGTTSRLPLTAHNAGDSSRNDKAPSRAYLSRSCRIGWKMPSAPATGLSSLKLGLDSTPQVYAYTNGG
ncbi:hypothetical protein THAOC_25561 [Thalassiosira oceanica]|uniref:Uncharacterized protein n=1 Tax=Thalassiosira oceanica TaxID=159749 RepID=K0S7J4_THAOC|nr:hypothetical protein THAOC_25561 [Thalassiosira oceanica]|eukprot:EJK54782.1 hypothetical protein THAOC_25561 [Thalassiosira oceanica]